MFGDFVLFMWIQYDRRKTKASEMMKNMENRQVFPMANKLKL